MSGGAGFTGALRSRLATAERNIAINTLRDIIDAGWAYLLMIAGIADEFEDETGVDSVASAGETYNSSGAYYTNLGAMANLSYAGVTFSSGTSLTNPGNAFDGNTSTFASAAGLNGNPHDLVIDFGEDNEQYVDGVIYNHGSRAWSGSPIATQIWHSDDGAAWVAHGDAFNVTYNSGQGDQTKVLASQPNTKHRYYRYRVANVGANGTWEFVEIQLRAYAREVMSLVSEAFAAGDAPNIARAVLLHEPVDTVALNDDAIIEVSRDDGETWSAGALENQGAFDATTNVLAAEIELSGQPSGSDVRWRFSTPGGAQQRLHGVYLQWG